MRNLKHNIGVLAIAGSMITAAFAADREIKIDDRLDASADALTDMMRASDKGIPQDLIDKAHCVVVVPGMKKAGFIFGAKYGRGFAVCRRHDGIGWSAPAAMRVEGGSVGFQIGASETDVVVLVMNDGGMRHLLSDKFTLGGDATVAAGPLGRDASAQTDAVLHAEMLSYSRSRGLFAGISLEGATLRSDEETNRELYGRDATNREILTGDLKTPAVAAKFEKGAEPGFDSTEPIGTANEFRTAGKRVVLTKMGRAFPDSAAHGCNWLALDDPISVFFTQQGDCRPGSEIG